MRYAVVKRLHELIKERGITVNKLTNLSGVAPSTVKNIFNGASQNPGVVTLKKLCDGLEISLPVFFDTEDFRDLEQEIQ